MQTDSSITARPLLRIALTALVALMGVSLAFVGTGRAPAVASVFPPGAALAFAKIVLLFLVAVRIRHANAYSLQWSSMLILLFIAEGLVRATSDPQPSAAFGWVETAVATVYFVAVLAILRPLKQRARRDSAGR